MPTETALVQRLWSSDVASTLTNQAAREIEGQRQDIAELRSAIAKAIFYIERGESSAALSVLRERT